MRRTHILMGLSLALLMGACQERPAAMPEGDDILGWAVEGKDGLSCDWFFFTAPSSGESRVHRGDRYVFERGDEWSPDGRWVVSLGSQGGLAITNVVTGSVTGPLLPESVHASDVSWSPDSDRIVFDTTIGQIAWMDVACAQRGADCSPEVHFLHDGEDPDWSPDGKSIAFAWDGGQDPANPSENRIFVMDMDDPEEAREITPGLRWCRDPDWSADGVSVVVACNFDIYIADADSGDYSNLTEGPVPEPDGWPVDEQPSWTPTGDRIAFLSDRSPGGGSLDICLSDARENAIYTVKPNGDDIRPVTSLEEFEIHWYAWMRRPQ